MHIHQNDKNEMTISSLNITYLYSFFPIGKWIVYFFFFAPAWVMIELKHDNVKFQIDFPILFFSFLAFFLLVFYTHCIWYNISVCYFV